jgi:hypothetical protein
MSLGVWEPYKAAIPVLSARVTTNEGATMLFLGDLHLDHPTCDRAALKRLLDDAVSRNAAIVLLGDVFDVMQGAGDRRGTKTGLMPAYVTRDDYLGAVLEDVTKFLEPYARNIWLILQGNHESSILKYHGVRLEQLLAIELNRAGGSTVNAGYQTYAAARLDFGPQRGRSVIVPFWVGHGHGGGGEVTKGVIQAQRRAVTYPDARFTVTGHVHSSYYVAHEQLRLMWTTLRPYAIEQEHYVVGGWKKEHAVSDGWHIERGRGPRLPSGWWAVFYRPRGRSVDGNGRVEFTRATP